MTSELDSIIPTLPVISFPKFRYKVFGRKIPIAVLTCPKCKYTDDVFKKRGAFPISYCRGSQPAEIEQELMNPFSGEKKTEKHTIICAHLNFEHFHCQCQVCDFPFAVTMPEVT
jgi:hypothetical protein